ncbi:MAG: sodium:proton antiporter [Peptococcaceae bacterium]|nr:sodium:proton antiporter [Peptococcaceae bacterium]
MKQKRLVSLLTLVVFAMLLPTAAFAEGEMLGDQLPIWSIIPFVGMLLSIAIFPLVKAEWWEKNQLWVALFWSAVFVVPFFIAFGAHVTIYELIHTVALDYLPFLLLLIALYTAAGGIVIRGSIVGTPKVNTIILAIGTVLASVIGTTGAAMVLIRPLIRANEWRKRKMHTIIFFIFLVCNIGGSLTPLGDPPLFMGYLRGVPFFWCLTHLWPMYLFTSVILLALYYFIENSRYKKDIAEGCVQPESHAAHKIEIDGLINIAFIVLILIGTYSSGYLAGLDMFTNADGSTKGITLFTHGEEAAVATYPNLIKDVIYLIAIALSLKFTKKSLREENNFNWGAMEEVAKLFIGIFITMIPALALLEAKGAALGLQEEWQFFWSTGLLSGFLDNTPTYLVFLTTAASLGATSGIVTSVGTVAVPLLIAVSSGAVFMGALSYIGNAPNFMVRSIAEEHDIKMPSFFGYMKWSFGILVPVFLLDTIIFMIL